MISSAGHSSQLSLSQMSLVVEEAEVVEILLDPVELERLSNKAAASSSSEEGDRE